jgi:hypothetical protein
MSGGLSAETVEALKKVKASPLMFPNMIAGELFDAAHTLGDLRVYPRTTGDYVVVDSSLPVGKRTVSVHRTVEDADRAMRAK